MPANQSSTRAGQYVKQPAGHRSFVPAPLPPEPALRIEGALQTQLSNADRALGRLAGSVQTLPNPDLFVLMYVRKEAVLSSQIEGTQSSLQDVLAAEAKIIAPDRPADVGEVINYVRAMNHGLTRLDKLPVSVRLIREIHAELMSGEKLEPGELRRSQNWIGPRGSTLADAAFVPPPWEDVPRALGDLETFLHSESSIPVLVKIGLAHAQFETIHPFLDGNGRVGRLLITFLLCEGRLLEKPVLYISHYFKQHRQAYYEHLQAVRDHGKWEEWLVFFLKGVDEVSVEAAATVGRILAMRERHRELVTERFGRAAGNGLKVLESLYRQPMVSVRDVRKLTKTSFPAANQLVARFVDAGILVEMMKRMRNRVFRYEPYINLFAGN